MAHNTENDPWSTKLSSDDRLAVNLQAIGEAWEGDLTQYAEHRAAFAVGQHLDLDARKH